jgi:LCP family protein required for cell wall assembly
VAGAALYLTLDGAFGFLGQPLQASTVGAPEWPEGERINVLLLGTDQREGEAGPPRTDTIVVATLDPQTRSAGMLSLPRDLWVPIPGHGHERINAAFELGEAARAGGGPDLARKTVEQLLGVPIHHYVLVGFGGFEKLVDLVGGVLVDVERPIKDNGYPDHGYGLRRIYFQPGLQRLDGEAALWYVRTRHADSDFGRARRQQQLLLALRNQVIQPELLPKAPSIAAALADTVKTDARPSDLLPLVRVAGTIDPSTMVNRVVDESMTTHWVTPAGAQVEVPDQAALRRAVQDVFGQAN